jgi:lipopolysaccharide biosynthesis protein
MTDDPRIRAGEEYLRQLSGSRRGYIDPNYRGEKLPDFNVSDSDVKLLAYYLPQFHPFQENDEWWGKGFTEWTNVTRARPQFVGHYQPHLPSDLGFYDLRNEDTMQRQIKLARSYGIEGFVFYYYWFGGKRLLEKPLDVFLRRRDFDISFSLCWANENWTRRWDGDEHEILLKQTHDAADNTSFIEDLAKYLKDDRYIHIDGRPLLCIYRVGIIPELNETVQRWRAAAKRVIGKDLFLVYAMTFGENRDPRGIGFDAAIQFPPHGIPTRSARDRVQPFSEDYNQSVWDYEPLAWQARDLLKRTEFPIIASVFPSWDNTARQGERASVYLGSSPQCYSDWLAEAAYHAYTKPVHGKSYVVINAWNEWAEGTHLEPDQKYGHAFLRASAEVLRPYVKDNTASCQGVVEPLATIHSPRQSEITRVGIIVHAYYLDAIVNTLKKIPDEIQSDVFVTLPPNRADLLLAISQWGPLTNLLFFPNRGRDMRPFLGALRVIRTRGYRYFVKLHTKRSVHRTDGIEWNNQLTEPLLRGLSDGSIEQFLDDNEDVAFIAPAGHILDGIEFMGSASNFRWMQKICRRLKIGDPGDRFSFVAGSMFAGRVDFANSIIDDPWIGSMFEDELGRRDGTLAHALERMFGLLCHVGGKTIAGISIVDGEVIVERVPDISNTYKFANTQPWLHAGAAF